MQPENSDCPPPSDLVCRLLSESGVCAMLDASRSFIRKQVRLGKLKPPLLLGPRMVRWRVADVQAFITEQAKPSYGAEAVEQAKALSVKAVEARRVKREAKAAEAAKASRRKAA